MTPEERTDRICSTGRYKERRVRALKHIREAEAAVYERIAKWHDEQAAQSSTRLAVLTVTSVTHTDSAATIRAMADTSK
jgi:hypothetical protein